MLSLVSGTMSLVYLFYLPRGQSTGEKSIAMCLGKWKSPGYQKKKEDRRQIFTVSFMMVTLELGVTAVQPHEGGNGMLVKFVLH